MCGSGPPRSHCVVVIEAVDAMDLAVFDGAYRQDGHGRAAYEPARMVALVLYAYARGVRSARAIERACEGDVSLPADRRAAEADHAIGSTEIADVRRRDRKLHRGQEYRPTSPSQSQSLGLLTSPEWVRRPQPATDMPAISLAGGAADPFPGRRRGGLTTLTACRSSLSPPMARDALRDRHHNDAPPRRGRSGRRLPRRQSSPAPRPSTA